MDKQILEIRNLNITKNKRIILKKIDLDIYSNNFYCVLGESGTGKTLLIKNIMKLKNKNIDYYIDEEIKNKDWNKELKIEEKSKTVKNYIKKIFNNGKYESYKLALLKKIMNNQTLVIIDDISKYFNEEEKKVLWKLCRNRKIAVLYMTKNIEDVLDFDYLLILKNNQVAIEGKTKQVLKEEKLLKLLGYNLPFYLNMSLQLELYGMIDKIGYNKEELEKMIWS